MLRNLVGRDLAGMAISWAKILKRERIPFPHPVRKQGPVLTMNSCNMGMDRFCSFLPTHKDEAGTDLRLRSHRWSRASG